MSTLVHSIKRLSPINTGSQPHWGVNGVGLRGFAVAVIVALVSVVPGGWGIAIDALSAAYLSVTVFVAGTLALVFAVERAFKTDLGSWMQSHSRWQVPAATLLGAFPGCGGAIIAVTQYTRGYLSFGGVVATLTATMGDAMFLLLAREPQTAVGVLAISMVVGVITGYVIDAIHGPAFMRPKGAVENVSQSAMPETSLVTQEKSRDLDGVERLWLALMIPGVLIGVLAAFQIEVDAWLQQWTEASPAYWIGVAGAVIALAMWAGGSNAQDNDDCANNQSCSVQRPSLARTVIDNTNFVTTWVVFAFVGFELLLAVSGIDMAGSLAVWAPLVPAMAILVGFIPGCGPQIMVTSMYLTGSVPLSAQMGNAIANDGDALFPALAVAPKAAMMATVYSAIPAIIVAYGWYILVELA